jgi:hypothetical protein
VTNVHVAVIYYISILKWRNKKEKSHRTNVNIGSKIFVSYHQVPKYLKSPSTIATNNVITKPNALITSYTHTQQQHTYTLLGPHVARGALCRGPPAVFKK